MTPEAQRLMFWRDDPVRFVREALRAEPDPWQLDALNAFGDDKIRRMAICACKGPGKTCLLAWLILHFLCTRGSAAAKPRGAATSISGDNLRDNLWAELGRWMKTSPVVDGMLQWSAERIFGKAAPEDWFMSARSWPKSGDAAQQANTLAGVHAPWVLFVLDESGGIPNAVMAAADGALATENTWAKIVQTGNPTHLNGPLHRACTVEAPLWYVIHITGDPDDPKRSTRIRVDWAREQIARYGRENPWVRVNVFGEFPEAAINTVLTLQEVIEAQNRNPREGDYSWAQKRLGVDVARFGDDSSVIFPRQGLMAGRPDEMKLARTTDIAARVMMKVRDWAPELTFVDDTGHWGHGVIDNLIAGGVPCIGIQFHGRANNPRYKNKRAEMWLEMAEWIKRGGCVPDIAELRADLTSPTYTYVNGVFQLEEKDQIKARLGRSTDYGDALALSFALPDMPGTLTLGGDTIRQRTGIPSRTESDWDPFKERADSGLLRR